jgi:uncharacterized protein (TIGR02246 family)
MPQRDGGVSNVVCERQRCLLHQPLGLPRGVVASHIRSSQPQEGVVCRHGTLKRLDRLFSEALNDGHLDALVALYEPQATLTPEPGQVVTGTQAIRDALSAFVAIKPTLTLEVKTLAQTGDLALTSAKWALSGTGPDGQQTTMSGHSVKVSRRQPAGSWMFVIDTPWGLGWGA